MGMLLAVAVFAWTALLGSGDAGLLPWCAPLSGVALGTDLACPAPLLAGVIAYEGDNGQRRRRVLWLVELCHQTQPGLAAGLALPLHWFCWATPRHLQRSQNCKPGTWRMPCCPACSAAAAAAAGTCWWCGARPAAPRSQGIFPMQPRTTTPLPPMVNAECF